jgi:hypothetical protein
MERALGTSSMWIFCINVRSLKIVALVSSKAFLNIISRICAIALDYFRQAVNNVVFEQGVAGIMRSGLTRAIERKYRY